MSDNSSIISGLQDSDEDRKPIKVNETYLTKNKKAQIKAIVQEQPANWGKQKNRYYKEGAKSDNSDAEEEEEAEAEQLQLQATQKLKDNDFWDLQSNSEQSDNDNQIQKHEDIPPSQLKFNSEALISLAQASGISINIIQNLEQDELNDMIAKAWPELLEIVAEIEAKGKLLSKLHKINKDECAAAKKYRSIRIKLISSYLSLLLFYLQLRSHTNLSQNHPIFQKIVEMKKAIKETKQAEKYVQLLEMHEEQQKQKNNEQSSEQEDEGEQEQDSEDQQQNTLQLKQKLTNAYRQQEIKKVDKVRNILESLDQELPRRKQVKLSEDTGVNVDLVKQMMDEDDDMLSGGDDELYKQNQERVKKNKKQKRDEKIEDKQNEFKKLSKLQKLKEVSDDDPRKINYIMLKNISLMRRRRGTKVTNSRVKHKLKYEKAIKKLKSQNKFMKKPQTQYAGENGIKSGLVKGVKLK